LFHDAIDFQYHTCGPSISIACLSRREDSAALATGFLVYLRIKEAVEMRVWQNY
jgi:hypothetical protein